MSIEITEWLRGLGLEERRRDLALFNLALDSKLEGP